jgi:hypothetical protein
MDDLLEHVPLDRVGEDDRSDPWPVHLPLRRQHLGPERRHHPGQPGCALGDHLAGDPVGVDHHRAELGQDRRDGALA